MIEIIPNWHPVFVHFTVALLFVSVLLFVVARFFSDGKLRERCQLVAQWNLWLGAGFTVLTVIAGVLAYNSVAHDTPSHEAMTEHRNWALVTAVLFVTVAIWSGLRARTAQGVNTIMLVILLVGSGLLAITAWHGGEAVYRFGLGVMSLPKTDSHDHASANHDHAATREPLPVVSMGEEDNVEDCELPEKEAHTHASQAEHQHEQQPAETKETSAHDHDGGHSHEGHPH